MPERSRTPGFDEDINESVDVGDALDELHNSESATVDDQAAVPTVSDKNHGRSASV